MTGRCIWITGLPGAGKTTLARAIQKIIGGVVIDGDDVRRDFWPHVGFGEGGVSANMRGIARIAHFVVEGGGTAIVACVSPIARQRALAKDLIGPDRFSLIYLRGGTHGGEDFIPYEEPGGDA